MEVKSMTIELANRLTELRKNKGLSQEELADMLHVSRQAISKWERGEASPDTDNLIELAKIYGVSLDELVGLSSPEKEDEKKEEVSLEGIHLVDDEGNEVHIHEKHVYLKDEDGNVVEMDKNKAIVPEVVFSCIVTSLVVLAYLLLGFNLELWNKAWVLFLLVIIIPSIFTAIRKKNLNKFSFSVFVVFIYLLICCWIYDFNMWHPLWAMFFSIPIYYSLLHLFKKKSGKEDEDDN